MKLIRYYIQMWKKSTVQQLHCKEILKKHEIGIEIEQDMLEKQAKIVFLSIGSNLGNRKKNIELVKNKLEKNKIKIIKSSKNYESFSWPDSKKPKFINVVLKIETILSDSSSEILSL